VAHDRHVRIGKLGGAKGLTGGLKLISYAEALDLFSPGLPLLMVRPDGSEEVHHVEWVKPQGRSAILALKGIGTRSGAESLAGAEVFIEKALLPELEEGTYYWADLIGLSVFDAGGEYLGRIEEVIATGSNDVYVVQDAGREILVPALKTVVRRIDLAAKRMEVDLPAGLT
jgi:16S rRNA processing protein RimM